MTGEVSFKLVTRQKMTWTRLTLSARHLSELDGSGKLLGYLLPGISVMSANPSSEILSPGSLRWAGKMKLSGAGTALNATSCVEKLPRNTSVPVKFEKVCDDDAL